MSYLGLVRLPDGNLIIEHSEDALHLKCKKCNKVKTLSEMIPDKKTRIGYRKLCKDCNRKRCRKWKSENQFYVKTARRVYQQTNTAKEKARNRHKKLYWSKPEIMREKAKVVKLNRKRKDIKIIDNLILELNQTIKNQENGKH